MLDKLNAECRVQRVVMALVNMFLLRGLTSLAAHLDPAWGREDLGLGFGLRAGFSLCLLLGKCPSGVLSQRLVPLLRGPELPALRGLPRLPFDFSLSAVTFCLGSPSLSPPVAWGSADASRRCM